MVSDVVDQKDEPLTSSLVPDSPPLFPSVTGTLPAVNGQLLSGGTSTSDDILIVSCGHCEARNVVETSKDSYYVVFKGKGGVGIYRSVVSAPPPSSPPFSDSLFQDTTNPFCQGVPNASVKRFTTRKAAFEALGQAETSGVVQFL